jgi:hypothetical protein
MRPTSHNKVSFSLIPVLAILGIFVAGPLGASPIAVDAVLSHAELSATNPIGFSVRFPGPFLSIDLLTIDAFWIGDGLDPGEIVTYDGLGGVGVPPGGATQFFRRLTFPASLGFDLSAFLDGEFDGMIFADQIQDCEQTGLRCRTTVTFDRLVFTIEGEPARVPEPGTGLLLITMLPFVISRARARLEHIPAMH